MHFTRRLNQAYCTRRATKHVTRTQNVHTFSAAHCQTPFLTSLFILQRNHILFTIPTTITQGEEHSSIGATFLEKQSRVNKIHETRLNNLPRFFAAYVIQLAHAGSKSTRSAFAQRAQALNNNLDFSTNAVGSCSAFTAS